MAEDFPTRSDYFEIARAEALSRSAARPPGQRLDPAMIDLEGSDINLIMAAGSAMADEATRHLKIRMAALYLDSAEGEDLDRLVADRFSPTIVRKASAPSVAAVELSRSAGAFPLVTLPVGTKFRTDNGTEFESKQVAPVPAGSSGPVRVDVEATAAGEQGNVAKGTITQIVKPTNDPNLRVTNPEPAAGGDSEETDARLRARARLFFDQARRGTVGAIEFGALQLPGVRQASALELLSPLDGLPTGHVQLFIADANAQANAALRDAVLVKLREFRGAGVVVDVQATQPQFVSIVYQLAFNADVDTRAAFEAIRQRTVAEVNLLPPNAVLERALLTAILRRQAGVQARQESVVAPSGDLVPAPGFAIRTSVDRVTRV